MIRAFLATFLVVGLPALVDLFCGATYPMAGWGTAIVTNIIYRLAYPRPYLYFTPLAVILVTFLNLHFAPQMASFLIGLVVKPEPDLIGPAF